MADYQEIEALITDRRFQELKYKQEKTNVFSIVGRTHTEHWHSSFLSWLLDAHSSLRLGHFPLARLLTICIIKNPDCGFTLRDIYSWDLDAVRFSTEKDASYHGKKRSIDVYGESSQLVLVIENKVNARENYNHSGQGQTMDYYNYVEAHKKAGQRALYFFITADQNQTAFADMYVHISYQEMFDNVISKCIEHPQVPQDGKYLLEQYAANLRETIHNSNTPMALVNTGLCRGLYQDHAAVLDEMFALVDRTDSLESSQEPACIAYEHYQDVFDEIFLSLSGRYGRTPKARLQRQVSGFTGLYDRGVVQDGMLFHMEFEGELYYARAVLSPDSGACCLQILDEAQQPYLDPVTGQPTGVYDNSSSAGVAAINLRRRQRGIAARVKTVQGTVCWKNSDGKTIQSLLEAGRRR